MSKISISITDELDAALDSIAISQGTSKSRVIDTYLRENPIVRKFIEIVRAEPNGILAVPENTLRSRKAVIAKSSP